MIVFAALGTLCCIVLAFTIDSYSVAEERWRIGPTPWNNVIIPLLIAPPFFLYLLSKVRQLAIAHASLTVIATTDSLTSCLTRAAFSTMVEAYLDRLVEKQGFREGALLVVDVDNFKAVNDGFGHDVGDDALRLIVTTMKSALRDVDLLGRMGGEEFSVFLPGLPPHKVKHVAERLRSAVDEANFRPNGGSYDLSISVGGVTFGSPATFSELYKSADRRLYEAKQNGRNRVELGHIAAAAAAPAAMLH